MLFRERGGAASACTASGDACQSYRGDAEERPEAEECSTLGRESREERVTQEQKAHGKHGACNDRLAPVDSDNEDSRRHKPCECEVTHLRNDVVVTPCPRLKARGRAWLAIVVVTVERGAEETSDDDNECGPKQIADR